MLFFPPVRRIVSWLALGATLLTIHSGEQKPVPTSADSPPQMAAQPVAAESTSPPPKPAPPPTSGFHLTLTAGSEDIDWNGEPVILEPSKTQHMAQTTNGSMIFTYQNVGKQNSLGKIGLAPGGKKPEYFDVPPLTGAPLWIIRNWQGNNLQASNYSMVNVPIRIQAVGPGIPGDEPNEIVIGTPYDLPPGESGLAQLKPAPMQFIFSSPDYQATFAMIGGPPDANGSNAYTFTVNSSTSTVLPQGDTPPPGNYSTTANKFEFSVNWGSSWVYFVNLSGETSEGNSILINKL